MFNGRAKCSANIVKYSTEARHLPQRLSNVPQRCEMFHGDCQVFHGRAKCSTESVKCWTDVLNDSRRLSNFPHKC